MDPNALFRRNIRTFYGYLGALLVAGVAPLAAVSLINSDTLAGRVAGVAVGTATWVPLALILWRIVRDADEFMRKIHLVAIAITFAGAMLLIWLFDWLARAEFMDVPPLMVLWLIIAVVWIIALIATKRRYEREP